MTKTGRWTANEVFALARRVRPAVAEGGARVTPLVPSAWLTEAAGRPVWLKCENLQLTGSFKLRGALAALALLDAPERGVFTASTGNHGQALALAARRGGLRCTVVVPRGAPANKLEKIRGRGAEVVVAPCDGFDEAQEWALEPGRVAGTFVSAYEDPGVAAGNGGTTMLEVLDQLEAQAGTREPAAIVVPTGGGGLVVGVGAVARELAPRTRVVAVNPEASPALWQSRRDGRAYTTLPAATTLADGVEGGVGAWNAGLAVGVDVPSGQAGASESSGAAGELVDDVVTVPEAQIAAAMRDVALREKLVVEGSAALGPAALLAGELTLAARTSTDARPGPAGGEPVVLLLTGGNVDPATLAEVLANSA